MDNDQIIYGIHPVEELLHSRLSSVDHVFFEREKKNSQLFELMKRCRKERLSYNLVPELKLRRLTGTTHHQGIAAISSVIPCVPVEHLREILRRKPDPLIVLPASIEDPGNLGAIIRSAVGLGADALLLERKHTASLNAAVAKSSAGMVEHIAISRPKNLEALLAEFTSEGYRIIGAQMKEGKPPFSVRCTGPLILILGGEHRGIPPYLLKQCTELVSIPMNDKTQSLNVSATAAILLYEINRQRTAAVPP
ncbi:MAG: 23S rRNA (guanosine(2251)-2'-O)-methyltransferase RlmB [Chitinispirillaceae bacterium]|nr:23S rRNA (guanosine(2251)-2'-O)-methyltransferase RlmB [Chitinispirillaceae bacterium]